MLLLAAALQAGAQEGELERARGELEDAEIAYAKSRYSYPLCGSPRDDFDRIVRKQATELDVAGFTLTG
jgi:hypothetical protein